MGDAIQYCEGCETNVMCHMERRCMLHEPVIGQCDRCQDMGMFLSRELPTPCGCSGTVHVKLAPEPEPEPPVQDTQELSAVETQRRVLNWKSLSNAGLRLRLGELTAQEIRTIRAVLSAIYPDHE